MRVRSILSLLFFCCLAAVARAQVGSTTDIITGAVRGPAGQPIEGARVEVTSIDTKIVRNKLTNAKGQFTIIFPDGGGNYLVSVRYVGMQPAQFNLLRQADED